MTRKPSPQRLSIGLVWALWGPLGAVSSLSSVGAAPAAAPAPRGTMPTALGSLPALAPVLADRSERIRGRPRDHGLHAALWLPRLLLSPLWLASELFVRTPLLALATWLEERHVVPAIQRALHPLPWLRWSPTLSLDVSLLSLVGLEARLADARGRELRATVAAGALDAYTITVEGKAPLGIGLPSGWELALGLRAEAFTLPDRPFYGLGARPGATRQHFRRTLASSRAWVALSRGTHLHAELGAGFDLDSVGPGRAPSAPLDVGTSDAKLALSRAAAVVDTRASPDDPTGARATLASEWGVDVALPQRAFWFGEAEVRASVELGLPDRVLAVGVWAAGAEPLGSEPVPLQRLPSLGGLRHAGFAPGRFRGATAAYVELSYRYPIAYFVDLAWTSSVGGAFGRGFSDFDARALALSFGLGLRTRRTGIPIVQAGVAWGTSPLGDAPLRLEGARVMLGTTEGP
jgi:hypothetical protein